MSSCYEEDMSSPAGMNGAGAGAGAEIMLFGVRVKVDPMRKSVSLNNLSQYEQPNANVNGGINNESSKVVVDEGYASADDVVPRQSSSGRERKRGVPWTEEEHKLFLLGLQKVGKGDWRGISRNFVKTRTPTQVASHAQKYFLRRSNLNRRRRRSSLFDITTDSVSSVMSIEEVENPPVLAPASVPNTVETFKINAFPVVPSPVNVEPLLLPERVEKPIESLTLGLQVDRINNSSSMLLRPIHVLPVSNSSTIADLNSNHSSAMDPSSLSLRLSLSLDQNQSSSSSSSRHSAFQVMSSFTNGDSIISVA